LELINTYFYQIITASLLVYSIKKINIKFLNITFFAMGIALSLFSYPDINYLLLITLLMGAQIDFKIEEDNVINIIFIILITQINSWNTLLILLSFYLIKSLVFEKDKKFEINILMIWTIYMILFIQLLLGNFNFIDKYNYYLVLVFTYIYITTIGSSFVKDNAITSYIKSVVFPVSIIGFISTEGINHFLLFILIIGLTMLYQIILIYRNRVGFNCAYVLIFIFTSAHVLISKGDNLALCLVVNSLSFYLTNLKLGRPNLIKFVSGLGPMSFLIIFSLILFNSKSSDSFILDLLFSTVVMTPFILFESNNVLVSEHNNQLKLKKPELQMAIVSFLFIVTAITVKITL
jgi:hypothetical protein